MKSDPQKILIIRLSSIGDILLTTPFIRQARKKYPDAQIDYIIKTEFRELLEDNPHIDNLIDYDLITGRDGLKKLKKKIIQEKYNIIFDLHNNLRSNYIKRGSKSRINETIVKNKITQFLYVNFKLNRYNKITPIPQRYLNVGIPAGVVDDEDGLEMYWKNQIEKELYEIWQQNKLNQGMEYFSVAPGAGLFTKTWPIEFFDKLVEKIIFKYKSPVVILGSDSEKTLAATLCKREKVIDLTGKLSLKQTASAISKSMALISNDSGLMHMATAVNVPVLAIFGSTTQELGFFPYRSKNIVVENENLNCRPCSHIGKKKCPKKHFKCMMDLSPDFVMLEFERLMS